jgi:hypothetical protein
LRDNFAAVDSKERPFCFSATVANLCVIEQLKEMIAAMRDVNSCVRNQNFFCSASRRPFHAGSRENPHRRDHKDCDDGDEGREIGKGLRPPLCDRSIRHAPCPLWVMNCRADYGA